MDEFETLVEADTRSKATEEEAAWLRKPENLNRWERILIDHLASIDSQMLGKGARVSALRSEIKDDYTRSQYLAASSDHDRWLAGALRVKSGVEKRLREVRALRSESGDNTSNLLIQAIETHRDFECMEECDKVNGDCLYTGSPTCLGDQKLWQVLVEIGVSE